MRRFLLSILFFAIPLASSAAVFGVAGDFSLRQGQTVNEDLYAAGGTVTIVGPVSGDVIAAGGNVFVGETIGEGALLLGDTVNVITSIGERLRVISRKTLFRGETGGDFVIASGEVQLLPESIVHGSMFSVSGRTVIDGTVEGDLRGAVGILELNGKVEGDVRITADSVIVGPFAEIHGSLSYSSPDPAVIAEGSLIQGEITHTAVDSRSKIERFVPTIWGTWLIIKFLVLFMSALVIHAIFHRISETFISTALSKPAGSLAKGFLFLFAVPLTLFLILLTFIGFPFFILASALYIAFLVIAYLFSPIILGVLLHRLFRKESEMVLNAKVITLGVVATIVFGEAPFVGLVVQFAIFLLALGAIFDTLFTRFIQARER